MTVHPGDIYWLRFVDTDTMLPHIPHPHVIIQADHQPGTWLACSMTTNRKKISIPGNILLEAGEANLPKPSIIEVAKQRTLTTGQLGDYIGTLSDQRMRQLYTGWNFLQSLRQGR